jgi:hypothetical protein
LCVCCAGREVEHVAATRRTEVFLFRLYTAVAITSISG